MNSKASIAQIEHLEQQRQYLENMQNRLGEIWKKAQRSRRPVHAIQDHIRQTNRRYQERRNGTKLCACTLPH